MIWLSIQKILILIQHGISFFGIIIILSGIIFAVYQYICYLILEVSTQGDKINKIRLDLGRILILGLEFIIAADLIGTTTAPDYYSVGIVAIVVAIRTILSYSLNRELKSLSKTE
jgi:uncharacterized membrane protein